MRIFKRPLAALLSVLMLFSVVTGLNLTANAESGTEPSAYYTYNILVRTTDDADDWNGATVKLFNSEDSSIPVKEWNIMSNIDDSGEEFKTAYNSPYFYDTVNLRVDFGGNIAIHSWKGTFTVNINGKEEKTVGISESSGVWSSVVANHAQTFAKPYPVDYNYYAKDQDGNKQNALKFYQGKEEENVATGYFYIQLTDQYGTQWKDWNPGTVSFNTGESSPVSAQVDNPLPTECKIKALCTGNQNTSGSINFVCSANGHTKQFTIDNEFIFWHSVNKAAAEHGTYTLSDDKAYIGDTITVNATPDEGYRLKNITVTDADGGNVPVADNKFTMPASSVSVAANFVPITYMAKFVAEGNVVAEVPYTVETTSITEPDVPQKAGYTGVWKPYELTIGGVTVEAAYDQIIHDFRVTSSTPATCTSEGYDTYTCIYCGDTYNKTTTPVKAHQFVSTGFTAPTCTEAGYQSYRCLNCETTYTGDFVNAKGHAFVADVVAPTCTQEGYTTYTCEVCGEHRTGADGAVYKTNITVPVAHAYKVSESVAATCNTEGYDTYTCVNCGDTYNKTTTPALTHEWRIDKWTNDETDHWHVCTRCDAVLDKQAHTYGVVSYEWEGTTAVTASHTCTVCGYVESEQADITYEKTKDHTCTVKGETTYTAAFTNPAFETQVKTVADIPALGHNWKTVWSKNGTHHWHDCTRCKAGNKKAVHTYGTKGASRYTCSVCGYLDKAKKREAEKADKELAYANFVAGLKGTSTADKVMLKWGKVKGADRYVIYAVYCGDYNKYKKIGTINGNATTYNIKKLSGKKIDPKQDVKAYVVPQKKVNGKYVTIFESPKIHIAGAKSVVTNAKKVNVEKSTFTLNMKKTALIKPSLVLVNKNKKMIDHVAKFRYFSGNTAVATVNKNGTVKAVGKGTTHVYVYANNGFAKAIKVIVK